jgi:3-methylcrotonyl-CoA carboxylase alpha subunit
MFQSILVANRGEIACRIIRTARRMGLRTIAVYSRIDTAALHVKMAHEAHYIGPAPAAASYLNQQRILQVACETGAQCIHPGYGFLSENADFAEQCAAAGVTFIGPPPSAIRAMGLKDEAKKLMQAAGVPVTPGYHGLQQDTVILAAEAEKIGYPVLIKAVAGGGGKGMRRVGKAGDFAAELSAARREAQAAFSNDRVLLEKWIHAPRHIEIQIMADGHGNIIHLNERDCSIQRRHQKVIEEAPAPNMDEHLRAAMGKAAIEAARAVAYTGAGTVEFIVSGHDFHFMEMNTRLQVEHPVTEAITGLDLVELQIKIAAGEKLPLAQTDVPVSGHAIEARLYAEDPANQFLPSTGTIAHLRFPEGPGVRVDTGVSEGTEISPWYDPMIAKIICHGQTRTEARSRLLEALMQTGIAGPKTNAAFLIRIAGSEPFASGLYTTSLLGSGPLARPQPQVGVDTALVRVAALALLEEQTTEAEQNLVEQPQSSPWDAQNAFQFSGPRQQLLPFTVDGILHQVIIIRHASGIIEAKAGGNISTQIHLEAARKDGSLLDTCAGLYLHDGLSFFAVRPMEYATGSNTLTSDLDCISAPMHGRLSALFAKTGQEVKAGAQLAIVEAMKMEHVLTAPRDGTIDCLHAQEGAQVSQGDLIMSLVKTA